MRRFQRKKVRFCCQHHVFLEDTYEQILPGFYQAPPPVSYTHLTKTLFLISLFSFPAIGSPFMCMNKSCSTVSYTHLDVYKRQVFLQIRILHFHRFIRQKYRFHPYFDLTFPNTFVHFCHNCKAYSCRSYV